MRREITSKWRGLINEINPFPETQNEEFKYVQYSSKNLCTTNSQVDIAELMAAAQADCYMMNLIFGLSQENFAAEFLETTSEIHLSGELVVSSHLLVKGKVPGITFEKFQAIAIESVRTCPVSRGFNTKVTTDIILI